MVNEKILSFTKLTNDILNQNDYKYISSMVDVVPANGESDNYTNYDNGYSFE